MMRKIAMLLCAATVCVQAVAQAQNRYEEVIPVEVLDGRVVLGVTVEGAGYRFVLDPSRTTTAVLAGTRGLTTEGGKAVLEKLGVAENLFVQEVAADVIADTALAGSGIAGIIGRDVFKGMVLTIDAREGYITLSAPYKPSYMPLRNRAELSAAGGDQTVASDGRNITAPLDSLLAAGVLTLDMVRGKSYFERHEKLTKPENPASTARKSVEEGAVTHLDRATFLREVFDFRNNDKWKYKGDMPCVIDFWATWCKPCLKLDPVIKSLAEEYRGRVKFYKVNVDEEKEIAAGYFNVVAIPLLVFIPANGEPVKVLATSREEIVAHIEELLEK